jgi:hypothetical protein
MLICDWLIPNSIQNKRYSIFWCRKVSIRVITAIILRRLFSTEVFDAFTADQRWEIMLIEVQDYEFATRNTRVTCWWSCGIRTISKAYSFKKPMSATGRLPVRALRVWIFLIGGLGGGSTTGPLTTALILATSFNESVSVSTQSDNALTRSDNASMHALVGPNACCIAGKNQAGAAPPLNSVRRS